MTFQDDIELALVARFVASNMGITWERVERYAIDDAARMKKFAIGLVDQGQKFMPKVGISDQKWRMAVEFFARANNDEDMKTIVNQCRAVIYKTMMTDYQLVTGAYPNGMLIDTEPVVDEVFVSREDKFGEGVLLFDLTHRTPPQDIGVSLT